MVFKRTDYIISGTDTGVGKTVAAAMLAGALSADYWKPVQAGLDGGGDTETARLLSGLPPDHFHPERYRLTRPLSPHQAAWDDGITIEVEALRTLPESDRILLIEGAGGLLVPLTRRLLMIDLFKLWEAPVILCARTGLGTINHSLLSAEALRARNIALHGIIFVGGDMPETIRTIADFSGAKILGRLPLLPELTPQSLQQSFAAHFNRDDF